MAVETKLATGYWMRKMILTVLFLTFGIWAVYDGWVKWPKERDAYAEYLQYEALEQKRQAAPNQTLFGEELRTWQDLQDKYKTPPRKRTQLDINIQRYVLVPLCFPIAGLLVVTWVMSARKHYAFGEDGSLVSPEGRFSADQMTGIDMSRWMSKSIAMLEIEGGPKHGGNAVKLDAWIYDGMEEIIETLNKRFHPEEYTEEEEAPAESTAPADEGQIADRQAEEETISASDDEDEEKHEADRDSDDDIEDEVRSSP